MTGIRHLRRIVVVGGSLAGQRVVRALRGFGFDGELTVIGQEPHRPYDRYPLSKGFLVGDTDRHQLDIGSLPDEVVWRFGETVTGLDLAQRLVVSDRSAAIPFDGLVVATGARPRGASAAAGVRGAFVLRTVDDATRLRECLDEGPRRVVVVGGGLIGAEVAAAAVAGGHDTTLVDPAAIPTQRTLGDTLARHLLALHRGAGVRVRSRCRVRALAVRAGAVIGLSLDDGGRIPADVVLLATGTTPNVEWLQGSGLEIAGGLRCRSSLHALGHDGVVGAGDVALVPQPLLGGQPVRVEHWASTLDQSDLAAANLLRGPNASEPLDALPTFGTTIHGARIRSVGHPQLADGSRVLWGSVEAGEALLALQRGRQVVAVLSLNAHDRLARVAEHLRPNATFEDIRGRVGVTAPVG